MVKGERGDVNKQLKNMFIVLIGTMIVSGSSLFGDKFEDFKLINERDQNSKKLVRGFGGGGGHGGGGHFGGGGHSFGGGHGGGHGFGGGHSGGRSFSGHSGSRSSVRSSSRSSTRSASRSSSRSGKSVRSHAGGHGGHGGGHGGHGGHGHGGHGHGGYGHGGCWGHGWGYGWACCAGWWGGAFWGFGALYPFWYPFGGFWGPYWAATWPWALGLGLYYYPGTVGWYMNAYSCWAYPFAGLGYGLIFADQGYFWYPTAGVGIYLEVTEGDAPSTYAFIENEKDEDLYYALYRKVDSKVDGEDVSYLIRVSVPQVISTAKTVKVYLPEDVSKEKEYVVIARRNEADLKDNMDEKGNEIGETDIIKQIREEDTDLVKAHNVEIAEPSEKETQDLSESRQKALKNKKAEIINAVNSLENQDKSKLPTKEQLEREKETAAN